MLRITADNLMKFEMWIDVDVLDIDVTRMPNSKQSLSG